MTKMTKIRWRPAAASVLVAALMALAVSACGGSKSGASSATASGKATSTASTEVAAKTGLKIAFVCATGSQQPFFVPIQRGAEAAARAVGASLDFTGLTQPNQFTAPIITNALKVAIDQKPAALVVCDFFPPSEDPLIKQARAEGIPVFISNSGSSASDALAIASFTENNYEAGEEAGKLMAQKGAKDVVCVDDNPGNTSVVARCSGLIAGAKAAGIQASADTLPQGDSSDATEETTAVKALLASKPQVDGVVMMGPVQGPAAVLGVQQAGRSGKVMVGTFDLSSTVLKDVKSGSLAFAIWQEPYLQGYLPVQAAASYVKYGLASVGTVGTGPVFVTSSNVAKVQAATAAFGG